MCARGECTRRGWGWGTRTGMHPDRWSRAAAWTGGAPSGRVAAAGSGHPRVRCVPARALTASWRSSRADSAEWPPGSACRLGPRRGRSRSSGSAAPAAQTPAPAASASPAGPRAGPAAAAGAPGPAGCHSGPGLGPDGCPETLRRAESLSAAGSRLPAPQEPAGPTQRPCPAQALPDADCPHCTRRARAREGAVGTARPGTPPIPVQTLGRSQIGIIILLLVLFLLFRERASGES